jgi:hypothetical protein
MNYGYMDAHKYAVIAPRRRRPTRKPLFLKVQETGQGHLAGRAGKVQLDNGEWASLPV